MKIDSTVTPKSLQPALERVFGLAAAKARNLDSSWDFARGIIAKRRWSASLSGFVRPRERILRVHVGSTRVAASMRDPHT